MSWNLFYTWMYKITFKSIMGKSAKKRSESCNALFFPRILIIYRWKGGGYHFIYRILYKETIVIHANLQNKIDKICIFVVSKMLFSVKWYTVACNLCLTLLWWTIVDMCKEYLVCIWDQTFNSYLIFMNS